MITAHSALSSSRVEAIEGENLELRLRLEEAEATMQALRHGEVDAIVIGDDIYTLEVAATASNRLRIDVLAQMEEAVVAVDGAGHVIYLNPAAERQYGMTASLALGLPDDQLFQPAWLEPEDERHAAQALQSGGHWRGRQRHLTFTGRSLLVEVSISPLRDRDADGGSLAVIRDLSRQAAADVALQQSRSHLQFALDAAGFGSWDFDLQSGQASRSLRHDQCFGYPEGRRDWDFETFLSHVHADDRAAVERAFGEVRGAAPTGGECHVECRVRWPDGSEHWIEAHGTRAGGHAREGAEATRMVCIFADITERKRADAVLREADRRKDEFLATLAHELRNPLAPIRNSLQIMRLTREAQAQGNALGMIERQVAHMVHLVDDLMDASRISQGKLELRVRLVDVHSVLEDALDTSQPLIAAKRQQLVRHLPEGPIAIEADATRLTQVVANLLNNASKFTPDGGLISLSAVLGPEELSLCVEDSGIGILGNALPRVFDMFSQFDAPSDRVRGGLGIGLALVKRLVEMHGGRIEAHSAGRGRGARFTVRLPLSAASKPFLALPGTSQDARAAQAPSTPSTSRGPTPLGSAEHEAPHRPEAAPAAVDARIRSPSRLAAVKCLGLLDAPSEEAFDRLTRLAARLLDAPASFLAIVDRDRDFYLSEVGLTSALPARQMSGRTFCHLTLNDRQPLVINDTHARPEWKSVPTVASMGVRAYVGVPLQVGGENVGSFCVVDTTPRCWSMEELEVLGQLAESAQRELSLRRALDAAREEVSRAREAARAKEEIVATVAHDLRTPLQVLRLNASLLQATATTQQNECAGRMHAAIDAMATLTQDLLSQNAFQLSQPARREPIAIDKLSADVVSTMGLIARRAGIALVLDEMPSAEVSVDYAQMLRVFCNLVGNSLKYCPPGSVVTLEGSLEAGEVRLAVNDNGPGMNADEQARAFERGWQGKEGLSRLDGAGLGLPIVRSLVEHNGGHVSLVSAPGQGTSVIVRLAACVEVATP